MPMVIADMKAAFATVLASVTPSIGRIHTRRRSLHTLDAVREVFYDEETQKLKGAFLTVEALPEAERLFGNPAQVGSLVTVRLRVELFRGFEDAYASETEFDLAVMNVVNVINATGRVYSESSNQAPLTIGTVGFMMAPEQGGALLHYASGSLNIRGRQS